MTKHWRYHIESATPHVWPEGDLIDHDTDTDGCICGPCVTPVKADDGSVGWITTHHALDGRERTEVAES